MAIVNVLRFNELSGAMISDEEYWVWGRRRSFFTDHIYHVSESPLANELKMELIYGGTGHPPFHFELIDHLRKKLRQIVDGEIEELRPTTTESVGYMLLDEAQKTFQRRINNQLQFLYGLTIDDVNRGFCEQNGRRYDINQSQIKQDVSKLVNQGTQDELLKPLGKSRGVLIGIDPIVGFSSYFLNYEKSVLAFSSGGFEAIGTGKYASGIAIGNFLNTVNLATRRSGINPLDGVYTLFESALSASESFKEVGGYLSLTLISAEKKTAQPTVEHIHGHRAKLASEIVQASRLGQVSRHDAYELVDRTIFGHEDVETVEEDLFRKAGNRMILELRLAGFKADVEALYPSTDEANGSSSGHKTKKAAAGRKQR